MTKIYTKTGDRGTTGTFLGRMSKTDQLARTLGTIDELNSAVGCSRQNTALDSELQRIQKNLLTIGSSLSGSGLKISTTETKHLEKLIDQLTRDLPKLNNFIYPVGQLHLARSICRRAEREVVEYANSNSEMRSFKQIQNLQKYLNRLSDALFTIARWVNNKSGIVEEVWRG